MDINTTFYQNWNEKHPGDGIDSDGNHFEIGFFAKRGFDIRNRFNQIVVNFTRLDVAADCGKNKPAANMVEKEKGALSFGQSYSPTGDLDMMPQLIARR